MSLQRNLFFLIRLIPFFPPPSFLPAVSQRSTAPQDQLTHLPRQGCPLLGGWCVVWARLFHCAKEPHCLGPLTVRTPTPQVHLWASDTTTPAWVSSSNTSSSSSRLTSSPSTGATTLQGEHNVSGVRWMEVREGWSIWVGAQECSRCSRSSYLKYELKLEAAVDDAVFFFNTPCRSFLQSILD